jgi:hypothetical protein
MSQSENNKESESEELKDQIIVELIEQRKTQQEALLKIMTSMEKDQEALNDAALEKPAQKKRLLEKIFSTDKKANK